MLNKKTIPFHLDVNHGFAVAQGLMHIKKNEIILEFEVKDSFAGLIKSGLKEVHIPFKEINSITFKKKFWGSAIVIEGDSMRTFDQIPEAEQGRCELKVKRRDRDAVEQAISSARVALSEYKLKELED